MKSTCLFSPLHLRPCYTFVEEENKEQQTSPSPSGSACDRCDGIDESILESW